MTRLSLLVALLSTTALASGSKSTLTLLPIARELGTFGLEYEHGFKNTTWFLAPSIVNPLNGQPVDAGLDVGLRFYPFAPAPRWFFMGPHLGGSFYDGIRHHEGVVPPAGDVKTLGFRLGASAGVTVLLGDVLVLSASLGGEYFRDYYFTASDGRLPTARFDLRPIFRGAVGFAF